MRLKEELGKKIRRIRESLGLSREAVCDDESELTVRQLFRIEKGESLPTLSKLEYISNKLEISMITLIDDGQLVLSEEYLKIKDQLISSTVYGDNERIKEMELLFDEVYERYYDHLPEEEQLVIDVINANFDICLTEDHRYGEAILEDYMGQILLKSKYTLNDIVIISLYLLSSMVMDVYSIDINKFNDISEKLLDSADYSTHNSTILIRALQRIIYIKIKTENYLNIDKYFDNLYYFIKVTNSIHRKPIVTMLEAKYLKAKNKSNDVVKDKYQEAIVGAEYIGDEVLVSKLKEEMKMDLNS
ncbi:transcriptional regulator [Aerococcaceae bacterium NML201296]|nr:transcriptional regulator [Aerococcaceae bacterium NML201296]